MNVSLNFPPTPEFADKHANLATEIAKNAENIDLDFSVESLNHIEFMLDYMNNMGATPDDVGAPVIAFGFYVGEVMRRHAGGSWRNTEETPFNGLSPFPSVVELPDGGMCDPIGKAFKRLTNGIEDNIPYFYETFTGQDVPELKKKGLFGKLFGRG